MIVSSLGFNTDDDGLGTERLGNCRTSREQASATDANEQHVEIGHLIEEFERGGTLSGHHIAMIKRRNDDTTGFAFHPSGHFLAILAVPVIFDDLGAPMLSRCPLHRRCIVGHHNRCFAAEDACGPADRLTMISR